MFIFKNGDQHDYASDVFTVLALCEIVIRVRDVAFVAEEKLVVHDGNWRILIGQGDLVG